MIAQNILTLIFPLVKKSFHFAEEIFKEGPNLYMASQYVDSLFTNIPLDETIDIYIGSLYNDNENTPKIRKNVFLNLLDVVTKESILMFNNKFYKQIDGIAMMSPLCPALVNIFISSLKINGSKIALLVSRQYVDYIFLFFSSFNHAEKI